MSLESLIRRDEAIANDILTKPVDYMQTTYGLTKDSVYELRHLYIQREIKKEAEYKK